MRAEMIVTRAQIAGQPAWERFRQDYDSDTKTTRAMMEQIAVYKEPVVLLLGGPVGRHASIAFAYDESKFFFYDVNYPKKTRRFRSPDAKGNVKLGPYVGASTERRQDGSRNGVSQSQLRARKHLALN